MDLVPLIPKAEMLPNSDISPLIREFFQDEIKSSLRLGSTKKLSQTIVTSLQYKNHIEKELDSTKTTESLENLLRKRGSLLSFSENVFKAYVEHEEESNDVREAEKNIFEVNARYLKRKAILQENELFQELYLLKRQPQMKALDKNYVQKYKLLEGESGLPPHYEAKLDFRIENFGRWRKRLESISQDSLIMNYVREEFITTLDETQPKICLSTKHLQSKENLSKIRKCRPKGVKLKKRTTEIFRAEPKIVFFTGYKPGDVYTANIEVKNIHTKGMLFQLKPTSPNGPFHVYLKSSMPSKKLFPGLSFQLVVEFAPKSLDVIAEDVYIAIEGENKLLIPLVAYLEPPILKTHKDINEFTKLTVEKIASSFIECGTCFTGDSKVTKLRFKCYRGSGEFFVMSSENWNRNYINSVTNENFLETPPFRVYPVYFKLEKNEVIDLFVEFFPKNSGTHVENIMIACDNGEVRSLDLLGDALGWHSFFFSFQDDLLKELPVDSDDDPRVKYYIDFGDVTPVGKVEKSFAIRNNSNMSFEYQWKIREVGLANKRRKYLKLSKYQIKVEPESGTLEPNEISNFNVFLSFDQATIGEYRMVLSLYILNLPYQCIEEDNTIIQPTGLVRNLYSQNLYGEEEFTTPSPELMSLQGTYESLQESIKSYVEYQSKTQAYAKNDFCRTVCMPNSGLCAKPLKKSKTYFHIADNMEDEGLSCICRGNVRTEESTKSDTCTSSDKIFETALKNEVIWDFVDILVDEIEVWVEVSPVKITIEPTIIELPDFVVHSNTPACEKIIIVNHSRSKAKCQWLKPENNADCQEKPLVTVVCHQVTNLADEDRNSSYWNDENTSENEYTFSRDKIFTLHKRNSCDNNDKVENCFHISGFSEIVCSVQLTVSQPGKFSENLFLSVDDGIYEITLLIQGNAVGKYLSAWPRFMDFRAVKQGTRTNHRYEIKNEYSYPINITTNRYDFDFSEEMFTVVQDICEKEEFRLKGKKSITKAYFLDARVTGFKCSILEISARNHKNEYLDSHYIFALGDVRVPSLSLTTSRYKNAILAPLSMMYIGEKVSSRVTLTNRGKVSATFAWGPTFGCHSRKIKVAVFPQTGKINPREKQPLEIVLTPLDEGIIDHCYLPCYFCRSSKPLILSIVGIIDKMKVTFEILDSKNREKTAVRISWPLKNYDPNLGEQFRKEAEILSMKCHCFEVDEEATRAFGDVSIRCPEFSAAMNTPTNNKSSHENPKVFTGKSKDSKSLPEENFNCSLFEDAEKKICSTGNENLQSIQKYGSHESFSGRLQLIQAELEFLNVSFATPVVKRFVIRNETPIKTKFHIFAQNFGEPDETSVNPIVAIKNRVMGSSRKERRPKSKQPILLEVNPSKGDLLGHEAVCIIVKATGNTWGEYRDVISCHIDGVRPFNLKVFVQLVGHPFYFPMFENYPIIKPVLRFQPVSHTCDSVTKKIRVINRSAVPITISWLIFLSQPFSKEEEHEDIFNLCLESNANFDSNHSEGSTKSVKVYLPKNISDSASTFRNMLEMRGTFESFGKGETLSDKNENQDLCDSGGKNRQDIAASPTEIRSESQQFMFRIDVHNFRVDPKELFFEAFEEKKISVTFDPRVCKTKNPTHEYRAVLTGCVKLKPSDEKCPGLFYRPTGMNFLSEIMEFNAVVETPVVSFEILKGDLRFYVDANDVIKSSSKKITISQKYLFKNKNQGSIHLRIETSPGSIFRITQVETIHELYRKYNPDQNQLIIKNGECVKVQLECTVTYRGVIYAYEQLKLNRKKELNGSCSDVQMSNNTTVNTSTRDQKVTKAKEPWHRYSNNTSAPRVPATPGNSSLEPRDSFNINLNRMSSKSDSSVCYDYFGGNYYGEIAGETLALQSSGDSPRKPRVFQHVIVVEEEINFVQTGLMTQTIFAELHLSFPALRVSPKSIDIGNVYIGESAFRYCSLINLTGSPTDFKVKSKCNVDEFAIEPLTGNLPSANYNLDIGKTVTVKFTPKQPGYFTETYHIYCNLAMEFDYHELFVCGTGTWNEKYKKLRYETNTMLQGVYPLISKTTSIN